MNHVKGYFSLISEHIDQLPAKEIILAYEGELTHQVMKAFTQLVHERLEGENEDKSVRRLLCHVLVECLQNINRHAEIESTHNVNNIPGRGALLIFKTENQYSVVTANLISKNQVEHLKNLLEEINPLSEMELNQKYKLQLMEGKLSSKGGAGLGFIDIRRKTENRLEFKFIDKNEEISTFLFNVLISRK